MVRVTGGPVTVRRVAGPAGLLPVVAAAAWIWVVTRGGGMPSGPGTMGLGLPAFLAVWTLMTAAMMLPATTSVAALYARTITVHRTPRMVVFTVAYLLVWAAAGLPAYALAAASAVFAVSGLYQLTPLKDRCLAKCRSPIGLMLRYASYPAPSRDLRAGAHHGAFCLGCCWSLMVLLSAFGVMNLWAMVVLAAVITAEKLAPAGHLVGHVVGIVSIALAVTVFWVPALAPGLTGGGMTGM